MRGLTGLLLLALLMGCYANKPLVGPEFATFHDELLGRWWWPEDGESPAMILLVARFNAQEYLVGPEEKFAINEILRFYLAEVGGDYFIHAQSLDRPNMDDRDFMFARYTRVDADTVKLDIPDLDALPHDVDSSEELLEALRKGQERPGFYARQLLLRRVHGEAMEQTER